MWIVKVRIKHLVLWLFWVLDVSERRFISIARIYYIFDEVMCNELFYSIVKFNFFGFLL